MARVEETFPASAKRFGLDKSKSEIEQRLEGIAAALEEWLALPVPPPPEPITTSATSLEPARRCRVRAKEKAS